MGRSTLREWNEYNRIEALSHLHEGLDELQAVAAATGNSMLAYLVEIAALEAERVLENVRASGPPPTDNMPN